MIPTFAPESSGVCVCGNLWHMDEFLAHYFEPLLERLLAELSARA